MNRRHFLRGAGVVAAGTLAHGAVDSPPAVQDAPAPGGAFRLDYAPHYGMFRHLAGDDPIDQIRFIYDQGFRSIEDNGMRHRPLEQQRKIGAELERLGMRMGVFVANTQAFGTSGFAAGDQACREQFLRDMRDSVELAKRCGATWCTVVPGEVEPRLELGYQTANVIDALRMACEICEPAGLVMVLEPLNWLRDHPRMFLQKIAQAYLICRAADSPSCKILFDMYHQQITEGNIIPNIDLAWAEIAYFQIGDNPGRNEPTTGEINYQQIFRHLRARGYRGILGMEHGNSRPGPEGEQAVIDAYRRCDQD